MITENARSDVKSIFQSDRFRVNFIYFITMLAMSIKGIVFYSDLTQGLSTNSADRWWTLSSQILIMGIIPFVTYMLTTYKKKGAGEMLSGTLNDFGYKPLKDGKVWLVIVGIAIMFFFFTLVVSQICYTILLLVTGFTPVASAGTIYTSYGDLFSWIFFIGVLPAVFEELTHRGLLIKGLSDKGSEASAVLLSALLFSLMHTNIQQLGYTFVGGLILGYVAVRTKSIFPSMLIHFTVNTLSTIEEFSMQKGGVFGRIMEKYYGLFGSLSGFVILLILWLAIVCLMFLLVVSLGKLTNKNDNENTRMFLGKIPIGVRAKEAAKPTLLENAFLYASIALLSFQTLASLIWGMVR